MNTKKIKQPTNQMKTLFFCYLGVVALLAFTTIAYIYFSSNFHVRPVCFDKACIEGFLVEFKPVISIIEFFAKLLIPAVTGFGVYHALKNYINTTETSRLSVHLSHQNTFKDYLLSEIEKEVQISAKSIDILKWYNLAFPRSSHGSVEIGETYLACIEQINSEVEESNQLFSGEALRTFNYHQHQSIIIKELRKIGIYVNRMPKKDFFEVEYELFKLINKVNRELCRLDSNWILKKRKYA